MLMLRRQRRRKQQQQEEDGEVVKGLELPDGGGVVSQKLLRYGEPPGGDGVGAAASVPLRRPHHPRRRERKLRRADVTASIRMSLMSSSRQSHLVGPEDDVFRQFIADRLAEADADPYAAPYDRLRSYAYEGSGLTPAGSLSSLESCYALEPPVNEQPVYNNINNPPTAPRPYLARLTPWYGAAEEETIF